MEKLGDEAIPALGARTERMGSCATGIYRFYNKNAKFDALRPMLAERSEKKECQTNSSDYMY